MSGDPEIDAMGTVATALKDLQPEEQARVIDWASKKFGVVLAAAPRRSGGASGGAAGADEENGDAPEYGEFAELFAAANPKTDVQKALVAGYWVQVIRNNPSFQSQELNKELKHLGHYLSHITDALDGLIDVKPQQVLQLKKAGNTRQARKTYKLSVAGINAVKAMLGKAAAANGDEG
jgi:hypothetical protein